MATVYGLLPVKIASGDSFPTNIAPEFDVCSEVALAHKVPLKKVYAAALTEAQRVTSEASGAPVDQLANDGVELDR